MLTVQDCRPGLGANGTVVQLAGLLCGRLGGPFTRAGSGEAVRVRNGRYRERSDFLFTAHLTLLNSTTARRRTLLANTHVQLTTCFFSDKTKTKAVKNLPRGSLEARHCLETLQLRTGHSLLVAAYLHRIGRRDSAICPHCQGAEETVEHLVFQCPAHGQARRDTWPKDSFTTDPRRLWSYLEQIGAVTRPRPGMKKRETPHRCLFKTMINLQPPHLYEQHQL